MSRLRRFILGALFLAAPALADYEQPPFEVKDPAVTENFRNVFYSVDRLSAITRDGSVTCLDSPTFCVDVASHTVTFGGMTLPNGATGYIQNTATLQSGATFFVSSGTANALTASTATITTLAVSSGVATAFTAATLTASTATITTLTVSSAVATAFTAVAVTARTYQTGGIPVLRISTSEWSLSNGVNTTLEYDGANNFVDIRKDFVPSSDNAFLLGKTGLRWSAVWSANGTIQTSASKEKREIRELIPVPTGFALVPIDENAIKPSTAPVVAVENKVPRAIVFKWKDKIGKPDDQDVIGIMGDDLPIEAHGVRGDGTRDPDNFYTSAVIGLQSAAIRDLQKRLTALEAQVADLKKEKAK